MVYEILLHGESNAITGKTLCQLLDIEPRDVTSMIERERREGKPICASTGRRPGYYIPETPEEMNRYCGRLRHRAGEILKTARACKRAMSEEGGRV